MPDEPQACFLSRAADDLQRRVDELRPLAHPLQTKMPPGLRNLQVKSNPIVCHQQTKLGSIPDQFHLNKFCLSMPGNILQRLLPDPVETLFDSEGQAIDVL